MKTTPESALDWNRRYPPGTLVRVRLRAGESTVAETAGYAQQWGLLALIRLRDLPGIWTASALLPLAIAEGDSQPTTNPSPHHSTVAPRVG